LKPRIDSFTATGRVSPGDMAKLVLPSFSWAESVSVPLQSAPAPQRSTIVATRARETLTEREASAVTAAAP
jgi:hypothetical protein